MYENLLMEQITMKYCEVGISRSQMFSKIGVIKNFAKITRKHLCWSLFFSKIAGPLPATLLKRDSNTGVFL